MNTFEQWKVRTIFWLVPGGFSDLIHWNNLNWKKIIGIHKLTGKVGKRDFLEIINLYTRYKYGKEKSDLKIEIGVQEKKLYLELGPSFNYKKEHKLFISLHSESYEIINLKFNVLPEAVEAP